MSPTLENGTTYLLDRNYYQHHAPRKGDVIVFDGPDTTYIKRVAAAPGDTIYLVRSTGTDEVVMDWQLDKVRRLTRMPVYGETFRLIRRQVPEGYCYVLGDNLMESMDSRSFGLVPLEKVRGRVLNSPPAMDGRVRHVAGIFPSLTHS